MRIFVGNLSRDVSEDELRQEFAAFGSVDTVTILKDKFSGVPKGFGFVEMPVQAEAEAAIAGLNQKELKERKLTVNEARPMTERKPSNRGRRNWGGGGGGRGGNKRNSGSGGNRY